MEHKRIIQPTGNPMEVEEATTPAPPIAGAAPNPNATISSEPKAKPVNPATLYPTPSKGIGTIDEGRIDTVDTADTYNAYKQAQSQKQEKMGLLEGIPKGIIVISALYALSAVLTFFSGIGGASGQNDGIVIAASAITLILAIGLLFRHWLVRIILIIFGAISVFGGMLSLFGLLDVPQKIATQRASLESSIARLEEKPHMLTADKERVAIYKTQLDAINNTYTTNAYIIAYASTLFGLGVNGFIVVYLLRPSIKDEFGP